MPDFILLLALGIVVGISGATLGVGGGFITVPVLFGVLGWPMTAAVAASHFCTVAVSIPATARYESEGLVDWDTGVMMGGATLVGSGIGAYSMRSTPTILVAILFGVVCVIAGIRMWRPERDSADSLSDRLLSRRRRMWQSIPAFVLVGAVSGIAGLGGGVMIVPLLSSVLLLPTRRALATSAFMIGITSCMAGSIYFAQGQLVPEATTLLVAGVLPGAIIGAAMQRRWSALALRRVFALLLLAFALRVIWRALNGNGA